MRNAQLNLNFSHIARLLFNLLGYGFVIAFSIVVFTTYKPSAYIDNISSYIICDRNGRKFDIGPNFIYTFTDKLDRSNDKKARKLCEYNMIKDYQDSLKTPLSQNYKFYPVTKQESDWIRALFLSVFFFMGGSILLNFLSKILGLRVSKAETHDKPTNLMEKSRTPLTSILIETLSFTLAWLYLFTTIISLIRLVTQPIVPTNYIDPSVMPEPFEIPLYLLLTFTFVIVIHLVHTKIKRFTTFDHPKIRICILALLSAIFIKNLGIFPLAGDISPFEGGNPISVVYFHLILFLSVLGFFFLELLIVDKAIKIKKLRSTLLLLLLFLIIAVITFPPRFSIATIDYTHFIGPIWQILHGKTIYTEASSQYGFLSILFLAALHKLHLLPISHIPVFLWILLIVEYFICFYLVYKQSGNLLLSLVALFSIMTVNYFTFRILRTDSPQSGPMRWFLPIFTIYLLYRFRSLTAYAFIIALALFSFWVIDVGVALLFAYVSTIALLSIRRFVSFSKLFISLCLLTGSVIGFFLLINAVHILLGYSLIRPDLVFLKLRRFAAEGMTMLPIEEKNYFWLAMLFYFGSIIYYFKNVSSPSNISHLTSNILLLFSANLSLFNALYFVGRSHPAELYSIAPIFLLNGFILIGKYISYIKSKKIYAGVMILLILGFIIYPAWQRKEALTILNQEKLKRFQAGNVLTPEMDENLLKQYKKEKEMIEHLLPEEEVLIVSGDDTYLLYLTGKSSLLLDNPIIDILTTDDLKYSIQKVVKQCPKKIAVECRLMNNCSQPELYSKAFYFWSPAVLDAVQKSCNVKYKPIECTNQLCIAES